MACEVLRRERLQKSQATERQDESTLPEGSSTDESDDGDHPEGGVMVPDSMDNHEDRDYEDDDNDDDDEYLTASE